MPKGIPIALLHPMDKPGTFIRGLLACALCCAGGVPFLASANADNAAAAKASLCGADLGGTPSIEAVNSLLNSGDVPNFALYLQPWRTRGSSPEKVEQATRIVRIRSKESEVLAGLEPEAVAKAKELFAKIISIAER